MQELFGISMSTIAIVLPAIFAVVMVIVVILAWRNRIMLKLGLRNIPRRPVQSVLIILGLMLSTVIINSALGTGDTLVYTIRSYAVRSLGNTDEVISAGDLNSLGGSNYFDYSRFEDLQSRLQNDSRIDGLVPAIIEAAPMVDATSKRNFPAVTVFAPDARCMKTYTDMKDAQGSAVTLDQLTVPGATGIPYVYLDDLTAREIKAQPEDTLFLFAGQKPIEFKLKAVVKGSSAGSSATLIMPLATAQKILGKEGKINAIYVSNSGGPVEGARYTSEVTDVLENLPAMAGLKVEGVKQKALKEADASGSALTTIFIAFSLFSLAAGLLLIFLIFMMLAAGRKSEMGMARAIGTQRHHLIEMFIFEGTAYDLAAALVGAVLGVAVTLAIAGIITRIYQSNQIEILYHFEIRSVTVAFCLGMLVTFFTIAISSWRVSRLNIVRAIRDIPEPASGKAGWRWLAGAVLLLCAGSAFSAGGAVSKRALLLYLGVCLCLSGLGMLVRWLGARPRMAFTLTGAALLAWTLLPMDVFKFFGGLRMGIEMFFAEGMLIVLVAVLVTACNLDFLTRFLMLSVGRLRSVAPALKTALAYLVRNSLHTGMTLAMFSLVIFTVIYMSVIITASQAALKNSEVLSGGYDVHATVSYANPIKDIHNAIASTPGLNSADFKTVAGVATLPLEILQTGASRQERKPYLVHGMDNAFLDTNTFKFSAFSGNYATPREIWQAIINTPDLAVVSSDMVPSRNQNREGGKSFQLEGIFKEDRRINNPIEVEMRDPFTGRQIKLTVIGILDSLSFNYGVYTSQSALSQVLPEAAVTTTYLFQLKEGVDAKAVADALNAAFLDHGMRAKAIKDILDEVSRTSYASNSLLQGFMLLGLVVGVAALGVLNTRAVVERRHEIGVLRAVGFKRRTVQISMLIESSLIALAGILIGTVLALALSYNVINFLRGDMAGLQFQIPWIEIATVALTVYGASLLMTFLSSRQAAKIYPAEALRYE